MSGHVGNLSPEQNRILDELKESVVDVHKPEYDDYFYLRWLRARNFNKLQAEAMMRKSLLWRKRYSIDTVLTDYTPSEVLQRCYTIGFLGPDKDGCPIVYYAFKYLEYAGYLRAVSKNDVMKYVAYLAEKSIEKMKHESLKRGTVIERHTIILDGYKYGLKRGTSLVQMEMLNLLFRMNEENYPERLKAAVIINAPSFFPIIWNVAKTVLAEDTVKKVHVFGRDGYQDFFRSYVDPDVLPTFLGGQMTDRGGDPLCKEVINFGELVPESYYYSNSQYPIENESDVKCAVIDKRSCYSVSTDVKKAKSRLRWIVKTESGDIGIGLYYKASPDQSTNSVEQIFPNERVDCHVAPECCDYTCTKSGVYVIKLDNSHSWFYQKKVFYRILVTECTNS